MQFKQIFVLALLMFVSIDMVAETVSDQDRLQRMYQMRSRIQSDEANANRRVSAPRLSPQAIDSPTVSQMQQQVYNNLSRIENRFRCLDIDVKNEGGGITNIVCGANNGGISSDRTEAAGNIIKIGD